jgi:hypothetical protein
MISLGREPQGKIKKKTESPRGATDIWPQLVPLPIRAGICRRSAAVDHFGAVILGLTPQAMHLSPLRGSRQLFPW